MLRTQVYLTQDIYDRLQLQTQIYQVPMAEIVRKTLDKNLPEKTQGNAKVLLELAKLGIKGGDKNLSKNYKKYLFDNKYAKKSSR